MHRRNKYIRNIRIFVRKRLKFVKKLQFEKIIRSEGCTKNQLVSNWKKNYLKVDKWFGNFLRLFSMPNGKVDEGEIALIIGEGGLKKATLAK